MNIEELKRLAEAATPGPWEYDYDDQDHDRLGGILWGTNHYAIATIPYNGQVSDEKVTATGNYIAAANPAAILALIAEIDSLRDQVNGLTGSLDRAETVLQNLMSYLSVNGSWADVSPCEAEQRIRDGIDILVRPAVPAEWREVMATLLDNDGADGGRYDANKWLAARDKARALLQSAPQSPAVPELDPMNRLIVSDPKQPKPPQQATSVPKEWRDVMSELAADLQSACDAEHPHRDQYPSIMRKYNNDMEIVEKARALLQSAEAAK